MGKSKFALEIENEVPEEKIDKNELKKFATGLLDYKKDTSSWQQENPDEMPSYNFRLRLNKYQMGLLRHVANLEQRSLSNMIKVVLRNTNTFNLKVI